MATDDKKLDYIQERIDTVVDRVHDISRSFEGLKTSFEYRQEQDERMESTLNQMNEALRRNTSSLQEHMRRTDLLEKYVRLVDNRLSPLENELSRKKAIQAWMSEKLKFIGKLGAAVSAGGAIGLGLKQLLHLWLGI